MKTLDEIRVSKRLMVGRVGIDGGCGEICIGGWTGSIIWSFGNGWEHVSVCPYKKRIMPTWDDMCAIKDIFFYEDECAVEYHPPKSEYVNNMPNCLHLWRPTGMEMPMPPSIMVGIRKGQTLREAKREILELSERVIK